MSDAAIPGRPAAFAVARVAALTACSGLLFGYSTASIADWLEPIAAVFSLTVRGQEYLTVSLVISCFFGAVAAAPLARRFGRRMALAGAFVLAAAGYGVVLTEPSLSLLVFARVLIGLAVGISSMVAPMYAGEATPADRRGGVVALFQLAVTLGILAAYAVPLILLDHSAWPLAIGGGIVIPLAGLLMLVAVPESPSWLIAARGDAAARAAAGVLGVPTPHAAPSTAGHARPSLSLRTGATLAVLALCCGLFILQNLSGIDGILYYAPTIFTELGFPPGLAALGATFGLGLINVIATVIAILTVDRLGRRPLAIYGSLVMILGLSAVVAAHLWDMPFLGLAGLCVYIAAFALSLGPLPYVLMAELMPSSLREAGLSAASATSWLFNALVALFFLTGVTQFGLSTVFMFFALICLFALVISIIWLPETKGRSLEAIEENVLKGVPLRQVGR
ncbi:sugar porter family MFS transporter [Nitratireductor aquimarinus]|uniref:sugar porter family MFS transporter n=1 Tax=Alphaproteobacteria TaxID=28211 RepID=UPI0019D3BA2D|nr:MULTISPECIES: sugar porter family MFS transporter [Alphaproteobacteria]MBY6024450.1 sugar porter family MFS transporter [Nitratireductor sp. DP7N14-4]MBN7759183.1 sugar porter family MFS transporter [Nitratireductor aquimarinus]MBN7778612.1 sugar porter family MFS transporter [Nitratireductor pacificus]MBN7782935.1 sugar porter family MFS transporter [Nitratireductor pacificus]MBN7791741.1 sugar porter family MFS transporter [Nitratireductor aquimarinus]